MLIEQEGTTPLILAAANNHLECVRELLRSGADPAARRLVSMMIPNCNLLRDLHHLLLCQCLLPFSVLCFCAGWLLFYVMVMGSNHGAYTLAISLLIFAVTSEEYRSTVNRKELCISVSSIPGRRFRKANWLFHCPDFNGPAYKFCCGWPILE